MRKIFCSLCTLVLSVSTVLAQGSIQQLVDLQAAQEPLKGSAWGFYAVDEAGRVLASHNAGMRLMPASNRKLVTTGVALHAFGPDYRFRTSLGYTGTIEPDGTLQGDLYIIVGVGRYGLCPQGRCPFLEVEDPPEGKRHPAHPWPHHRRRKCLRRASGACFLGL